MLPEVDYMDSDHETVVDRRESEPRKGERSNYSVDSRQKPKDLRNLLIKYLSWPFPSNARKRPVEYDPEPIEVKIIVSLRSEQPNTIRISDTEGKTFFESKILHAKINEATAGAGSEDRDKIHKFRLTIQGVKVVETMGPKGPEIDLDMHIFGKEISQVKNEPHFAENLMHDPEIAELLAKRAEFSDRYKDQLRKRKIDNRDPLQKLVDWEKIQNCSNHDEDSPQCETVTPQTIKTTKSRVDRLKAVQRYAPSNFANLGSPDDVMTSVVECEDLSRESSLIKPEPTKAIPVRQNAGVFSKKPIFPSATSGSATLGSSANNQLHSSHTGTTHSHNLLTQTSGGSDPSKNLMIDVLSCDEEPDAIRNLPVLNDRGFSSSGDDPEPIKVSAIGIVKEREFERQLNEKNKTIKDQELMIRDRDRTIENFEKRIKELEKVIREKDRQLKETESKIREAVKEREKQLNDSLKISLEKERKSATDASSDLRKANEELQKKLSVAESLASTLKQKYEEAKAALKRHSASDQLSKKGLEPPRVKTEPGQVAVPQKGASEKAQNPNIAILNSKLASMNIVSIGPSTGVPKQPAKPSGDSQQPVHPKPQVPGGDRQPGKPTGFARPSNLDNLNKMLEAGNRTVTMISESQETRQRGKLDQSQRSREVLESDEGLLGKRKPTSVPGAAGSKMLTSGTIVVKNKAPVQPVKQATAPPGVATKKPDGAGKMELPTKPVPAAKEAQMAWRSSGKKGEEPRRELVVDSGRGTAVPAKAPPRGTSVPPPKAKESLKGLQAISFGDSSIMEDSPKNAGYPKPHSSSRPFRSQIVDEEETSSKKHRHRGVSGREAPEQAMSGAQSQKHLRVQSSHKGSRHEAESKMDLYLSSKRSKMVEEPTRHRAKSQAVLRETSASETDSSRGPRRQGQPSDKRREPGMSDKEAQKWAGRETAKYDSRSRQFQESSRKGRESRREEESFRLEDGRGDRHRSGGYGASHRAVSSKSERKMGRESPVKYLHKGYK